MCLRFFALLLLLSTMLAEKSLAATFSTIDYPGATTTVASGVNDAGDVVGSYTASFLNHGFLLRSGTFTTIDFPGAYSTAAQAINESGEIVGSFNAGGNSDHGFILQGTTYTRFDYPGAVITRPYAINNAGDIVGEYVDRSVRTHGFKFSEGVFTSFDAAPNADTRLTGINNNGDMYGNVFLYGSRQSHYRDFRVSNGSVEMIVAPVGYLFAAGAGGINDMGQAVSSVAYGASTLAVLLSPSNKLAPLQNQSTLATPFMTAMGINNSGLIVGLYIDASYVIHGYIAVN